MCRRIMFKFAAINTRLLLSVPVYAIDSYNPSYAVSGSATGGRWKTIVNVDVDGGGNDIQDGSYWEVESSPAQGTINAITDNTIPSITAHVTIKNEGGSGYE